MTKSLSLLTADEQVRAGPGPAARFLVWTGIALSAAGIGCAPQHQALSATPEAQPTPTHAVVAQAPHKSVHAKPSATQSGSNLKVESDGGPSGAEPSKTQATPMPWSGVVKTGNPAADRPFAAKTAAELGATLQSGEGWSKITAADEIAARKDKSLTPLLLREIVSDTDPLHRQHFVDAVIKADPAGAKAGLPGVSKQLMNESTPANIGTAVYIDDELKTINSGSTPAPIVRVQPNSP